MTEPAELPKLLRVTSVYSDVEDRFRITGEVSEGDTRCLWFTQRLLVRLVPHMLEWLGEIAKAEGKDDFGQAELMQDFAQQAAKARLEPQTEVPVPAMPDPNAPITTTPAESVNPAAVARADNTWLVHEIDITKSTNGVLTLTFKHPNGGGVQLGMAPVELRQWLIILHSQWSQTGWTRALWPEWIDSTPKTTEQARSELH